MSENSNTESVETQLAVMKEKSQFQYEQIMCLLTKTSGTIANMDEKMDKTALEHAVQIKELQAGFAGTRASIKRLDARYWKTLTFCISIVGIILAAASLKITSGT